MASFANEKVGDLNGDGRITIEDASILVKYYLGNSIGTDFTIADVNNDGVITMADANAIVIMAIQQKEHAIKIQYSKETKPIVFNPLPDYVQIESCEQYISDIIVSIKDTTNTIEPVIIVQGECPDGRLRIDSNIDYTLLLNGIDLTSSHAPAINSTTKVKVNVILADGTENSLTDSKTYVFRDTLETSKGCLSFYGPVSILGKGALNIQGNYNHALYCKKSITVNDGSIIVNDTKSDAIHSGKNVTVNGGSLKLKGMKSDGIDLDDDFTMTGGSIEMNITGEAAKGIKCGGVMNISDGRISAIASGALKNSNGVLSYCTILKCDSNVVVSGGELKLVNNSPGGKCISVGRDLIITGGAMNFETHGDGAEYINADSETDYYTSKCIGVDANLILESGYISCLSTGIGGKGISVSNQVTIGCESAEPEYDIPEVNVITKGTSVANDVAMDSREGCPKAFKVGEELYIYNCDMSIRTEGMGGEGIECLGAMFMYDGTIQCLTFDDGINILNKFDMYGGSIYCYSSDNDGIDSNGKMGIFGGTIISMSGSDLNEAFDTEDTQLYLFGGKIFGIAPSDVDVYLATQAFYQTPIVSITPEKIRLSELKVTSGLYYSLVKENNVIMSARSEISTDHAFFFLSFPKLNINESYSIYESSKPINVGHSFFNDKVVEECKLPNDARKIVEFSPIEQITNL